MKKNGLERRKERPKRDTGGAGGKEKIGRWENQHEKGEESH